MMNTIDPNVVSRANASANQSAGDANNAQSLHNNFMTLLVTQLKNQNPLEPMDNSQMTAQLAQINTVSGIEQLNSTLKGITSQIDQGQLLQASALVGRGVLVPGSNVLVGKSEVEGQNVTTPFGVELKSAVENVTVTLTDSSGNVVRQFELGEMDAGVHSFTWDGLLDDGSPAPEGAYSIKVEAAIGDTAVPATALNYALVSGVRMGDQGPLLDVGGVQGPVSMDDVRQIL